MATDRLETTFKEALASVSLVELASATTRSVETWRAYKYGKRAVTFEAAQELIQYLRVQSEALDQAADELEAVVEAAERDAGGADR